MEEEKLIADVFTLMESTARKGRELVTKIFESEKENRSNNVNFTQFQILEAIVNNPNITQGDLCLILFKNQVYISKCLKFFESKKYVTRKFINNGEKVSTGYEITERGLIPYKVGIMTLNNLERKIISKLNENDVEKTNFYLNNLQEIIANIMETMNLNPPEIEEDGEEEDT